MRTINLALGCFALGLAFLLTACGSMTVYPVLAHEGEWEVQDLRVFTSTCDPDMGADFGVDARFETLWLDFPESIGSFQMYVDESDPGNCTQVGDIYECGPAMDLRDLDNNVTLTRAIVTDGFFSDAVHMEGDFTMTLQCRGPGCDAFAAEYGVELPCEARGWMSASALTGDRR